MRYFSITQLSVTTYIIRNSIILFFKCYQFVIIYKEHSDVSVTAFDAASRILLSIPLLYIIFIFPPCSLQSSDIFIVILFFKVQLDPHPLIVLRCKNDPPYFTAFDTNPLPSSFRVALHSTSHTPLWSHLNSLAS